MRLATSSTSDYLSRKRKTGGQMRALPIKICHFTHRVSCLPASGQISISGDPSKVQPGLSKLPHEDARLDRDEPSVVSWKMNEKHWMGVWEPLTQLARTGQDSLAACKRTIRFLSFFPSPNQMDMIWLVRRSPRCIRRALLTQSVNCALASSSLAQGGKVLHVVGVRTHAAGLLHPRVALARARPSQLLENSKSIKTLITFFSTIRRYINI